MHGPLRLSCVLLANYVPKYQMSSGPCGPIFIFIFGTAQVLLSTQHVLQVTNLIFDFGNESMAVTSLVEYV